MKIIAIVLGIALLGAVAYSGRAYFMPTTATTTPYMQEATSTMPTGKINIVEVCQSALAYTSFTDGAAAEAYVDSCIKGEHPEVIERWKADNGYGNGEAI